MKALLISSNTVHYAIRKGDDMSKVYDYLRQSEYAVDVLIECEVCEHPIDYKEFSSWDEKYQKRPMCQECFCSEDG